MTRLARHVPGECRDPMRRLQHDDVWIERLDRTAQRIFAGDDAAQKIGRRRLDADARRVRGDRAHDDPAGHVALLLFRPSDMAMDVVWRGGETRAIAADDRL